jgi:hypothetical protein
MFLSSQVQASDETSEGQGYCAWALQEAKYYCSEGCLVCGIKRFKCNEQTHEADFDCFFGEECQYQET